jgi:murein DD-endopeptidase MepM/ murein hydrolase activator NlpD
MNNNENNDSNAAAKSFFKQKGFYIVLAICIIAVAAILFATLQSAPGETPNTQENAQAEDVQNVEDQTLTEALRPSASVSPGVSASPGATASEVPRNMQKAQIVIAKPMDGDIAAVFCIDNLVYNKTLNIWQTHNGIDIVPKDNAEVKAALAGEVSQVLEDPGMGNMVVIKHSGNLVTKYAGLAEVRVKAGDKVQKGGVIGTCGTPPFEAHMGTHIHFEVWDGNTAIDPATVFEKQ